MKAKIKQPNITPIRFRGKDGYELVDPYWLIWEAEGDMWSIEIPGGFRYDGASVPRLLWSLSGISPDGLHRAAALVHDWLYVHSGELPGDSFRKNGVECDVPWTRAQADKLFANLLALSGVGKLRRRLMYLAVRAGGWTAWTKTRKQK